MQSTPLNILKGCHGEFYSTHLHPKPYTPGIISIKLKKSDYSNAKTIFDLPYESYVGVLLAARNIAHHLVSNLNVLRAGLIATTQENEPILYVIPFHGLDDKWKPVLSSGDEFYETYPGYVCSKNGPKWSDKALTSVQEKIRQKLKKEEESVSYQFIGDQNDQNLFAKLIRGEIPQWRIWESTDHVSFLTPFPNTPGFSVVIPRKHLPSDIFSLEENDFVDLAKSSYRVAELLKHGVPKASACALMFEGYEIDYAHAKVIPLIGDLNQACPIEDYCDIYKGYITSAHGPQSSSETIQEYVKKLSIE